MTGTHPTEHDETPKDEAPFELSSADERHAEPTELELGEQDIRLPWLEADDDDDEPAGPSAGQLIGLVLLGLAALGVIAGGIWWITHRDSGTELVADGGVIEAPKDPYKTAPEDPGGKTFDGTGDTSFAISKGQTRPARLGEEGAVPPSPAVTAAPKQAEPAAADTAPAGDGVAVQIGAYSKQAVAEESWGRLAQQYDALSGVRHRVVEGRADIGTVYRLQAIAADAAEARALCSRLKSAGLACQVKN